MSDVLRRAEADRIRAHLLQLLRRQLIGKPVYCLAMVLLDGSGREYEKALTPCIALTLLAERASQSKQTVVNGLRTLERLHLIQRVKTRILAVTALGGRIWKQLTSRYRLLAISRESSRRTDSGPEVRTILMKAPAIEAGRAQEAPRNGQPDLLARRREALEVERRRQMLRGRGATD
ncbi:MAG: hypothetical protein ACRYGR_08590 [Janthinobacterium lividum]